MNRSRIDRLGRALLVASTVLMFVFLLSICAFAQHAAKGNPPDDAAVGSSGQTVAVDANTGKLRKPTPEEIQQLISGMKLNDSTEGLTAKRVSNGSLVMDLEGRFENVMLVKINPDGSFSRACVTSAKQAEDFFKSDPTKKQPKAKSDPSTWEVK